MVAGETHTVHNCAVLIMVLILLYKASFGDILPINQTIKTLILRLREKLIFGISYSFPKSPFLYKVQLLYLPYIFGLFRDCSYILSPFTTEANTSPPPIGPLRKKKQYICTVLH
jgi:hypothetical protein